MRDARRLTRGLALVATSWMFLVLVTGATVTNTGSEQGCGRSWPLCHGQFIPRMAVSTAIEFSHRALVGVGTLLIIALAVAALALYRDRREIVILAPVMVLFLFVQAGLGAWAVLYPQEAGILALHFGVSLVSFASVLLTTVLLFEMQRADRLRGRPIPDSLRRAIWGVTVYSYGVVYLGAFVRHVNADDACSGWPLCNNALLPAWTGKVAAAFAHRVAAGLLVLTIVGLVFWCRKIARDRPDLYRGSLIALVTVLLQAGAGAIVALTNVDLFSALAHAALAGILFGSLAYLCLHTVPVLQPAPRAVARDLTSTHASDSISVASGELARID